jgi:periplasmic protein TonB
MAVQIFNDLPDVAVHRGDPLEPLHALAPQRPATSSFSQVSGRAWFAVATLALHLIAIAAFLTAQQIKHALPEADPMIVSLIETAAAAEQPRDIAPPPQDITFALEPPPDVTYETDSITPTPVAPSTAIANPDPATMSPPVVESVEYVRVPAPAYPAESSRRRERGTVLLRVLVDETGRPARIQLERSSGYPRLDDAARAAVQNALFRPYEVNGIAQPAQVLIPIEFTRRS